MATELDDLSRLIPQTFVDYYQGAEFLQQPVVMQRAQGLSYWDTQGKRYFDAIGGIFVASLGHSHPRVIDAVKKQLDIMTFAPPLHAISDRALELVDALAAVTPDDLDFVKGFSGGSESVESALKFVRQYHRQSGHPEKFKFISCYGGYHGGTFGAMSASGTGKRKSAFEPLLNGFIKCFMPTELRDHFTDWDECNRFAAHLVEQTVINEDPDTVAGIIIEPISNTAGIATPGTAFLQALRDICDRHNLVLIFDEVITGFGKTGDMFAAQTFGVTPDIICSGKGLSSGVIPAGAMIARRSMGEVFFGDDRTHPHFAHGHTYAGNPLASAAGMAVIAEIVEKQLTARARTNGEYLRNRLQQLTRHGVVREVRGKGMLLGVELVKDTSTNEPFPELGLALKKTAIENGLILRINPTWFAVAPALIAEQHDLDEMCDLIDASLQAALNRVG